MSSSLKRLIWLGCCLLVLGIAAQITHIKFVAPSEATALSNSKFVAAQSDARPSVRALPDNWQWHQPSISHGVYSLSFDWHLGEQVQALLIPTVRSNLSVSLNGHFLGDGGSMQAPIASNLRRPQFFVVPPSAFVSGNNTLTIELKSSVAGKGFLDKVYLGPHDVLQKAYQRHAFFRISLVESITYGLIITSLLMALLALMRPQNREYAWFALAALLWAAHNATNHVTNITVSNHLWDWFSYTTLGWFALAAPVVLARFKQQHHPRFEKLLLLLAISLPLIMLVLPQPLMHLMADYLWYPIALSIGGGALLFVAIDAWKTNDFESQLLTASGLFIIPYALHDLLLVQAALPWEDGFYIQFGAVVLLAVFATILLYRLVDSTNQAEQLNLNLSQQVADKTQEIQTAMQRTRLLEKNQWLSAERARITRDMHDGFAGQIASTLSSLKNGHVDSAEIESQLEYSINDLRLMIDSLDNEENDLVTLLGMFRYRVSPMLEHAGIDLDWQPLPADTQVQLTPSVALHLLRILQEVVNNAIRHARCDRVSIRSQLPPDAANTVLITVEDNGRGFVYKKNATEPHSHHRGLRNLRYRAEQIDATLSIESSEVGTKVVLGLPCQGEISP